MKYSIITNPFLNKSHPMLKAANEILTGLGASVPMSKDASDNMMSALKNEYGDQLQEFVVQVDHVDITALPR